MDPRVLIVRTYKIYVPEAFNFNVHTELNRYVTLRAQDLHVEYCKMSEYERFFIIYKRRLHKSRILMISICKLIKKTHKRILISAL